MPSHFIGCAGAVGQSSVFVGAEGALLPLDGSEADLVSAVLALSSLFADARCPLPLPPDLRLSVT
jgi:hypothetical protein